MAAIEFNNKKRIADFSRPYFIAEINSSHNGNVETAKEMIEQAKACGCDCVKFQSWSASSLYSRTFYAKNRIAERIVNKFSMSEQSLQALFAFCEHVGIDFSSTPYAPSEVDFLLQCRVPFVKIASMEINNYEYLKYIAQSGSALILSTGMAELAEIHKAVDIIKSADNQNLVLLHCISIYPAAPNTIHLNNISMLRQEFPDYPIGFSDHTLGSEIACAATALGTAIIEKHFTLDKKQVGMDNSMALEPDEMRQLIQNCINVNEAMGSYARVVSEEEYAQRNKMRRSVVTAKQLSAGHVLTLEDLSTKRPGDGFSADRLQDMVGRRLKNDVECDMVVYPQDLV